jgi:hypothetical protein
MQNNILMRTMANKYSPYTQSIPMNWKTQASILVLPNIAALNARCNENVLDRDIGALQVVPTTQTPLPGP